MLRRVARLLRTVLLVLGLLLVAWLPISYLLVMRCDYSWNDAGIGKGISINVYRGCINVNCLYRSTDQLSHSYVNDTGGRPKVEFERIDRLYFFLRGAVWPTWQRQVNPSHDVGFIWLPIWATAMLALAWPVTSFVIARRRRRGRGFEVEAVGGNAVSTVDS